MSDRRDRVKELARRALDLDDGERTEFLDSWCHDRTQRARVDALVEAAERSGLSRHPRHTPPPSARSGELVGRRVGAFAIQELLGEGGMGEVYRAWDERLQRAVALKFLPAHIAGEEEARRFLLEAQAASALDHPNICTIYEIEHDPEDGRPFIAMACYEGGSLQDRLDASGRIELDEGLEIASQVARGLAAAHARGIVHRDVKPANVMVSSSGTIKLVDFGLSKVATAPTDITRSGVIVGTVSYMAPEQARGEPVDARTDVWALGVVLYELVTGERPFRASHQIGVLHAILEEAPRPASALVASLPPDLDAVLARALAKAPDDRYQTATEMLEDLDRLASGHLPHAPPARRSGLLESKLALLALGLLLFAANFAETWSETRLRETRGLGVERGYAVAEAFHRLEGGLRLPGHDLAPPIAIYGSSIAYYIAFPLLVAGVLVGVARRPGPRDLRIFVLASAVAYGVSLPFFLFLPVPERWAFPDAGAILLSDLWSPRLIESVRPVSALDNCFPSFHVALTVVAAVIALRRRLLMPRLAAGLGAAVILSTVVLGIHWLPDVVAGFGLGLLAVAVAERWDARLAVHAPRATAGSAASSRASDLARTPHPTRG